jgi:transcriptional regulator with XRE-family HTH domain
MASQAQLFGDNLRRVCGVHDLSGQDLAHVLDVSPQTVSHWMQGRRVPTLDLSMAIQELFDLPIVTMLSSPFDQLLPQLGNVPRFHQTEKRIARAKRPLKAVSAAERKHINAKRQLDPSAKGVTEDR